MVQEAGWYTPTDIADELVPRFLAGEAMTSRDIAEEFCVERDSARQAVRVTRDVLLDQYNIVLPIAHWSDDYVLVITTKALDAFLGEVPQLRALRTRTRNITRRLVGAFALVKTRERYAAAMLKTLTSGISHMEDVLESTEQYMINEIERERA